MEGSWQCALLAHAFHDSCLGSGDAAWKHRRPLCVTPRLERASARAPASRGEEIIKQSRAELERMVAHPPGTPALRGYKYCTRPPFSSHRAPISLGSVTSCAVLPTPQAKGPWGSRTVPLGSRLCFARGAIRTWCRKCYSIIGLGSGYP